MPGVRPYCASRTKAEGWLRSPRLPLGWGGWGRRASGSREVGVEGPGRVEFCVEEVKNIRELLEVPHWLRRCLGLVCPSQGPVIEIDLQVVPASGLGEICAVGVRQ